MFSCPCPWSDLPFLEADHGCVCFYLRVTTVTCSSENYRHTHYFEMPFQWFLRGIATTLTFIFPEGVQAPWTCLCPSKTVLCGGASGHDSWLMSVRGLLIGPWTQSAQTKHCPTSLQKSNKNPPQFSLLAWSCQAKRDEGRYCLVSLTTALWFPQMC